MTKTEDIRSVYNPAIENWFMEFAGSLEIKVR